MTYRNLITTLTISPMLVVWAFLLLTLAAARVTRVVTTDKIGHPLRRAIVNKYRSPDHWLVYLLHCPFCASPWISLVASALWAFSFFPWLTALAWWGPATFAMSYLIAPVLLSFDREE